MRAIRLPILTIIYNRYHTASSSRNAVVELRIAYNNKQKYLSTGIFLLPKEWDDRNRRIINRTDAAILNKTLDKLVNDVRKVIYDMVEDGHVDIFGIPARLEAGKRVDIAFLDFCEKRAEIRKYGKATDSQERYDRFLRFLKDYGKIKTFYDLTESKVMELDRYLKKNDMKAKSRWNNYHRFLNSFILDAQKEGLLQLNPYDRVKIEKGSDYDGLDKCLSPEEFLQVRTATMPDNRLERVRDLFIFHTYTCLSYHDLRAFNVKKILEVDGRKVYIGHRGKTKIEYTVPIMSPAIEILEKYKGKLPLLSNVKYNAYLKEVAVAAGIDKPVTTHWARHTGATLLLNAGVPIEIVSKVCGHSTIKMTERIYAKLLPKTVVAAVNEIEMEMDLYFPSDEAETHPCIIYSYGGGFIDNNQRHFDTRYLCRKLADDGFNGKVLFEDTIHCQQNEQDEELEDDMPQHRGWHR